jgi:hypothetical protein
VQANNDSQGSISEAGVYIVDRNSERIFAQTAKLRRLIKPGEKRRFLLILRSKSAPTPTAYYCVTQFTDAYGARWNKYMLGRLESAADGMLVPQGPGCRFIPGPTTS